MVVNVNKPKVCGKCGALDAPLQCPCKAIFYCNAECQARSWREHREVCTHHLGRKLARLRGQVGVDDSSIGHACFNLGNLFWDQDRFDESEEHFEEALRIFTLMMEGEGHQVADTTSIVAGVSLNLGNVYHWQNRLDDSLRLKKQALRMYRGLHEGAHRDLATCLTSLGGTLLKTGDVDGAMKKYHKAHAMYVSLDGEDHEDVAVLLQGHSVVLQGMADALSAQGNFSEAADMLEKVLDTRRRILGPDTQGCAETLFGLGNAYFELKMHATALGRWEEGLGIVRRVHPEKTVLEGEFLGKIGCVYTGQHKFAEALAMYKKAHRIFRKTLGPESKRAGATMINIVNSLLELGNVEEAVEKSEEALAIHRRALWDNHAQVVHVLYSAAVCKRRAGDAEGAHSLAREAQLICRRGGVSGPVVAAVDALLAKHGGGGA